MVSRRTFLASLGAMVVGGAACGGRQRDRVAAGAAPPAIGIQLYTVRSLLARDFPGTLAEVARIGYREVELAGHHGHEALRIRAWLDASGIRAPSAHVSLDAFRDAWPRVLVDADVLGHRWLTVPWIGASDRTPDGIRRVAALLNRRGRDAAAAGMRVAYHNHDFELRGSPSLLETLLRETDPDFVDFQIDVYWLVRAGEDPLAWLARHPGRIRMLHLKDSAGPPAHRMVDVGAGTIDFAATLRAANRGGALAHVFVEHDDPADPMASARAGYAHLAALLARTAP